MRAKNIKRTGRYQNEEATYMSIFEQYKKQYKEREVKDLTIEEYLNLCKDDPMAYASAAERMLKAIGEPDIVDTSKDERLSRIFQNKTIARYPAFNDFYGMEEAIEKIVSYYKHAAQGLEERKQILYLLGPVGGGKSSIAEKLKELMEKYPIYVLVDADGRVCPNFESPLGLFKPEVYADALKDEYGIDSRYLTGLIGPWTQKRLKEYEGDITKFKVRKLFPSKLEQIAITKTEPGDENNQDISSLVGKVDIRKLERFSQDDPDAYSFSGGLCKSNQGLLEFVEMFKAPIKVLHPLLTATQEGNFMGTEAIAAIPFQGLVLAHSNETEWEEFSSNKANEAFLDRVCIVKVPYCLRVTEEIKIYEKLIASSSLKNAPIAPYTLKMLAQFMVLSRLAPTENSAPYTKLRVYDGESLKDIDTKAKPYEEYREDAGNKEGMDGLSTRHAYKILSRVFNFDKTEVAANPVHLMYVLQKSLDEEDFKDPDTKSQYEYYLKNVLHANYKEVIGKEIQTAYLESYHEYGQNLFNRYIAYADAWLEDNEYRDPETGERYDRVALNDECEKIEKAASIGNPKDFRSDVVKYAFRFRAENGGADPDWTKYQKMKEVIEHKMFSNTEDLLPVISFTSKTNKDDDKKHKDFVQRMVNMGYTEKQVRLLVEWYMRVRKSS